MDSLTQIVLGAAVGEASAGHLPGQIRARTSQKTPMPAINV